MWADPDHYLNSKEYRQKLSDRMSILAQTRNPANMYSRAQHGWGTVGGKRCYFRSSWERMYARYLEFLKGQKQITEWLYEPDVFWFEEIRRGVRSYKPDFKVINTNGSVEYHEVKGHMDAKSRTKIRRMAKYYPEVKLIVIGPEEYREVAKWGRLFLNFSVADEAT